MRETSALYRRILAQPDHYKEFFCRIGGVRHDIISCTVSGGLFSKVSVGGTEARQIDLEIIPAGEIDAENDEIELSVRLSSADGSLKSETLRKGTFFIDTNPIDFETGVMSIHGFDAMLKMESPMLPAGVPSGVWPRGSDAVMAEIAARIGVEPDPRNELNPAWLVPYPAEESKSEDADDVSFTMRRVAGFIAAMHGANWTITDDNRLYLAPLMPDVTLLAEEDAETAILFGDTFILV